MLSIALSAFVALFMTFDFTNNPSSIVALAFVICRPARLLERYRRRALAPRRRYEVGRRMRHPMVDPIAIPDCRFLNTLAATSAEPFS